ncbi:DUF2255 family protein [Burkholderia multivorans]|uniref:DUF2255 family protein n=1 Tax=Burkholderia multivorans TaxID=87883 RepID=UPI001C235EF6|nr:DUF2255 family protein [Burkholderia multivorans]MBU9691260.1 DUF2255 family protein [Burkholderia multivorans]
MWQKDHLDRILNADDLRISPFRDDGKTYGTPTWIWCVQVDGELYVRGYSGTASRWYQAAVKQRAGRISAAGSVIDVAFESVSGSINDAIDEAYKAKYQSSRYLRPMIGAGSRAATIKVTPLATA